MTLYFKHFNRYFNVSYHCSLMVFFDGWPYCPERCQQYFTAQLHETNSFQGADYPLSCAITWIYVVIMTLIRGNKRKHWDGCLLREKDTVWSQLIILSRVTSPKVQSFQILYCYLISVKIYSNHGRCEINSCDIIDGLVQEKHNFIANALDLCLSCTNTSLY